MLDMLNQLFNGYGFNGNELQNGRLYVFNDENIETYWFLVAKDIKSILDNQDSYFNECKEAINKKSFDRNCNMLAVVKIADDFDESLKNEILKIEENPYHFRKYVIYYKENELEELNKLMDGKDIFSFIKNGIGNSSMFEEFKHDQREFSGLGLFYRILIKMPFITIESYEGSPLENLGKSIKSTLEKKELLDYHDILLKIINTKSTFELNNMEPIEIFEMLVVAFGGDISEYKN
jgi:hypothetical protein